jgi:threonine dehydrogenase-like Zn-dependent dehydrogenase
VLSSVLACAARGEDPPCDNCAAGDFGRCDRVTVGDLRPGLQTGYCADTGGGWSRMMTAHRSQLLPVPDGVSDRSAVLVEPMAAAVHAALRARVPDGGTVLVVGAGTVGILTALAIQRLAEPGRMIVAAKHPRQRAAAKLVGATEVVRPEHAVKAVRRGEHVVKLTPERGQEYLLGGVDVAVECVGSRSALDLALRTTRAGGRVVLSGIPGGGADLTPLWFRELELVGAYTGGTEDVGGGRRRTFDLAMELVAAAPMLEDLVGATYPLARWREALDHALGAGALGTFKVAFAPQES